MNFKMLSSLEELNNLEFEFCSDALEIEGYEDTEFSVSLNEDYGIIVAKDNLNGLQTLVFQMKVAPCELTEEEKLEVLAYIGAEADETEPTLYDMFIFGDKYGFYKLLMQNKLVSFNTTEQDIGTVYKTAYNPKLSKSFRDEIKKKLNASSSSLDTTTFDMEDIAEAVESKHLSLASFEDHLILGALKAEKVGYIEI